jgi:hypothetical protein
MSRTQEIAGHLLKLLSGWEEPVDEAVIHSQVNSRIHPEALVSEFWEALKFCEEERMITGVRNKLRGTRWAITDKGRAQQHA